MKLIQPICLSLVCFVGNCADSSAYSRCFESAHPIARRTNLTIDGVTMPVGIWQLSWPTSELFSHIVKILVEETLGYHCIIRGTGDSASAVHVLAGCPDHVDCQPREAAISHSHLAFEVWDASAPVAREYTLKYPSRVPENLGSVGYDGIEGAYLKGSIQQEGFVSRKLLDSFQLYNVSWETPLVRYYAGVEDVNVEHLVTCAQLVNAVSDLNILGEDYAAVFPDDKDGVEAFIDKNGISRLRLQCPGQGYWWYAPACRYNATTCIAYITQESGWGMGAIMQRATKYNMPLALGFARSWSVVAQLVRSHRVLNYWYEPDATFADLNMVRMNFPRHRRDEWVDGLYTSQNADKPVTKWAHQKLHFVGRRIYYLAKKIELPLRIVLNLLLQVLHGESAHTVACSYLRDTSEWREWVPSHTLCEKGFGMASDAEEFVEDRVQADRCARCTPGRHALEHVDIYGATSICKKCVSGKFTSTQGSSECLACDAGKANSKTGQDSCTMCIPGKFSYDVGSRVCAECPLGTFTSTPGQTTCEACRTRLFDFQSTSRCPGVVSCICYVLLFVCAVVIVMLNVRRRPLISDISLEKSSESFKTINFDYYGKLLVTCCEPHGLTRLWCKDYTILLRIQGTGLRYFNKSTRLRARVHDMDSLEVLGDISQAESERLAASKGYVDFHPLHLLKYSIFPSTHGLPVLLWFVIFLSGAAILAYSHFTLLEMAMLSSVAILLSMVNLVVVCSYRRKRKAPMRMRLDEFKVELSRINPSPDRCPRGPSRAIKLGKLQYTYDFFSGFIHTRNAYYVTNDIIKESASVLGLSFSELMGPSSVQFFVSHCWGDSFLHFLQCLQKHASADRAPREGAPKLLSQGSATSLASHISVASAAIEQCIGPGTIAYWICFSAIRQTKADISEETGNGDVMNSSFFLALRSLSCTGTCLVVDEEAVPLTRIWCIFEILQTFGLMASRSSFHGLIFCTSTGVLNNGCGSYEAALAIVRQVMCLNLENAHASDPKDKELIHEAVLDRMGSFEALDDYLHHEMLAVLENSQANFTATYAELFDQLKPSAMRYATRSCTPRGTDSEQTQQLHDDSFRTEDGVRLRSQPISL